MKRIVAKILDSTHLELKEAISAHAGASIEIAIPDSLIDADRRLPASRHRQVELAWRQSHQNVLRRYANQWVVLEGEEIVAYGGDPGRLVESAREKGIEVPYVFYVDPPRPGIVKIGL